MNIKQREYTHPSHKMALNKIFITERLAEIEEILIELKNIHKPFFKSQFNKRDLKKKIKNLSKQVVLETEW